MALESIWWATEEEAASPCVLPEGLPADRSLHAAFRTSLLVSTVPWDPECNTYSKCFLNLNLMLRQTLKFLHVQNTEMGLKKDQYMEDMTSLSTLKAFSQCPKHRCWAVAHYRHHYVSQFVINNASRHF